MHTNLPLKVAAVLAVSLATLSVATGAAAQEDPTFVSTECGAGRTEPCGQTTTYKCEWGWGWTAAYTFPYTIYAPVYECEVRLRDLIYKNSTSGEIRVPSEQL